MSEKKHHWIKGIDSIRFFLALIVLLSHIPNPYVPLLKSSALMPLRLLGLVLNHSFFGVGAVIAFFIISGFVIHYPNRYKEGFNVGNFLAKRWLRIGIPLIAIGLVANAFGRFENIPIWSLYCELIYYTLYPMVFRIKISWKWKLYLSFILATIVILLFNRDNLLSLFYQKDLHYNINYWQLGVPLTWLVGLPCWLLGVVLAARVDDLDYTVSTLKIYTYRIAVYLFGMLVFSLAAHWFVSCILSLNIFALLLCAWIEKEIVYYRSHEPVRFLEYFGKFSYSLYLCHELCFMLIGTVLVFNGYTYFLYIALSIFIAYLVYLLVERPSHKLAQKIGASKKAGQ